MINWINHIHQIIIRNLSIQNDKPSHKHAQEVCPSCVRNTYEALGGYDNPVQGKKEITIEKKSENMVQKKSREISSKSSSKHTSYKAERKSSNLKAIDKQTAFIYPQKAYTTCRFAKTFEAPMKYYIHMERFNNIIKDTWGTILIESRGNTLTEAFFDSPSFQCYASSRSEWSKFKPNPSDYYENKEFSEPHFTDAVCSKRLVEQREDQWESDPCKSCPAIHEALKYVR